MAADVPVSRKTQCRPIFWRILIGAALSLAPTGILAASPLVPLGDLRFRLGEWHGEGSFAAISKLVSSTCDCSGLEQLTLTNVHRSNFTGLYEIGSTSAGRKTGERQANARVDGAGRAAERLKRLTQQFSDAGLRGDRATLDRLTDDDFVMTNEDGSVLTKAELLKEADARKPSGQTLTVGDFAAHVHGTVATVTFVDELKQSIADQQLDYAFRSTETWILKPSGWKMISSQTLALLKDPKAIALPASRLRSYAGRYRVAGQIIDISVKDGGLVAVQNGQGSVSWKAEAPDIFFAPGRPRIRNVFQRDSKGRITGFDLRREGRDLFVEKIGAEDSQTPASLQ